MSSQSVVLHYDDQLYSIDLIFHREDDNFSTDDADDDT